MILVTVGTTIPFDDLIRSIDSLIEKNRIHDKVICQIGRGKYIPKNCEYFRFKDSLDELVKQASLVVTHGGTGTVLSLLTEGKRFVAVVNKDAADNHQQDFLDRLSKEIPIRWVTDCSMLDQAIQEAQSAQVPYLALPSLAGDLINYIRAI
ncbi:PssE/Cps14G family polysaccharide biosynthesis glycosyltransferase [Methylocaldum szegediense]|uniref:Beta-1,4-N-acetylglucosaminyltransferase n=1 Tax=Methylocaldum szegediense TaxID=73780 RepID=A0ABN8X3B8_9GAMM|nr:PssE/Cps14G family polysaccharide biosynthesis glycosyltransferase [Methylocaldum szegediense]CAI8762295.1 beta-1,4-N-acetylglucosaminyltransferase [Methylocaldum szegediense]